MFFFYTHFFNIYNNDDIEFWQDICSNYSTTNGDQQVHVSSRKGPKILNTHAYTHVSRLIDLGKLNHSTEYYRQQLCSLFSSVC